MASESDIPTFTGDEMAWDPVGFATSSDKEVVQSQNWDKVVPSDVEEIGNRLAAQSLSTITEKVETKVEEKEKEQDEQEKETIEKEKDGPPEEEPDFGGDEQEKPQGDEGSKDSSIHQDADNSKMQPRENILVVGGATSEGETAAEVLILPSAKKRSQSIPPQTRGKSRTRAPSKSALRSRSRLNSRSPPRNSSRTRGRSGNRPILPLPDRRSSPKRGPRVVVDHKPIHQTPSAPINSKAAFLRRVSEMKIEGWALINCHLGSYYYDDSRWSLTHPRQLSSLSLRRDAELDNRWLCWQCNMPVEGAEPNDTAKTSFKSPVDQCYHWWQMHAGESHWEWLEEGLELNVTLPEVMYALGIDVDDVPFPLGTALEGGRIPRCIPSRPWKAHDERLFGKPWWRKPTNPKARSEQGLPWSPRPPSYPPPSYNKQLDKQYVKPTPKPAPYPPQGQRSSTSARSSDSTSYPPRGQGLTKPSKYHENQAAIKRCEEIGFPLMPGVKNAVTESVTKLGWMDPLDLHYKAVVDELEPLCAGHKSVGAYGSSRSEFHKKNFGCDKFCEEFLHLEEHAFYIIVYKLAATASLMAPDSLSSEQKRQISEALDFAPAALRSMARDFCEAEVAHRSLSSSPLYQEVMNYIFAACNAPVPLNSRNAPRAPGEEGKLTRKEQAALLL